MSAALVNNGVAKRLLENGDRFGRQYVVFQSRHVYPAYVVRYRMAPDADADRHVVRVESSKQYVSVTCGGQCIYKTSSKASKRAFVVTVVNVNTLQKVRISHFKIQKTAEAKDMIAFISTLDDDEIAVVAANANSMPREHSPVVTDVLRSLRNIGGSLHALQSSYALVGAKHPHLLNGLVHETHQTSKAAVAVDVRVIQYNRDMLAPTPRSCGSPHRDDLVPVRWQREDTTRQLGVSWKNMPRWRSQLTTAYMDGERQVVINDQTVDLVKMKVLGINVRCLNWKGEVLPPVLRSTRPHRNQIVPWS